MKTLHDYYARNIFTIEISLLPLRKVLLGSKRQAH